MARTPAKRVAEPERRDIPDTGPQRRTATYDGPEDGPTRRAVGFARVSTVSQANGWGLPAQRAEMERWCEANGYDLLTIFIDVMTSRRVDRLHGREAAVAAVEAFAMADAIANNGAETVLLVNAMDRASRSIIDGAMLTERARSNGWRLLGVDGTDSADDNQKMPNNQRLAFAEYERDQISKRTKEGLKRARAAGKQLGRRSTVPDAVICRILDDREAGKSFPEIAEALTEAGIPTPRSSERWRPAAVRDIYNRQAGGAS